jgi:hypothetical protein
MNAVGVRWTIGDVSRRGFEALRLSVWGAFGLFGPGARYAICVNSLSVARARALTGMLPVGIEWRDASFELPRLLGAHLDQSVCEGVGWTLAPLRCFPDRWELSLDNDVVLWAWPAPLAAWLDGGDRSACLLAEDVTPAFGSFASLCPARPLNTGIRGLPPGFDLEHALAAILAERPVPLTSELDVQGLQAAALARAGALQIVDTGEVSICSPLPPYQPLLGRAGARFVGLNARRLSSFVEGRPAAEVRAAHWDELRLQLFDRVGLPPASG